MRPLVNNQQPSLLELIEDAPRIALAPRQQAQLATLLQGLRSLHREHDVTQLI